MPHRFALSLTFFVIADVVAWLLTVHATVDYHAVGDGPTVLSLGDLLGWIVSIALLLVVVAMIASALSRRRYRRQASTMSTRR